MKIVVDMLGGDFGIAATKEGLKAFIAEYPDVTIYAVGDIDQLTDLKDRVNIIDAKKAIKMDAHAMEVLHDKESSMAIAIKTLLDNDADAVVSCGSTGALLTLATLRVKKINDEVRPALISPMPIVKENAHTLMLDLGANSENSVEELLSFIKMSKIYYQAVYHNEPTFALLSNGREEHKGNTLINEAHQKIKELNIPGFIGNIESSEILAGDVNIIVSDGFTGNIALKAIEGTGSIVRTMLKQIFTKSIKNKIAYLLMHKDLKARLNKLSSKPLGGAMFIGVKKVVVKAHGNSDAIAFKNAIITAYRSVKADLVKKISEDLNHGI